MPRYRSFGGLDDSPVEDGDIGFVGMNLRLPPWQLPAGMLALSENGRIDGEWIPRRGCDVVTEGSLSEGSPLRLPFWLVDANSGAAEGSQGLAVGAAERVGETVTLTVTGHGLPVGGDSSASAVVNPTGVNNSILYTAVTSGVAGTGISVEYAVNADPDSETIAVSVDGKAVLVTYGLKSGMVVSGAGDSSVDGTYFQYGIVDGLPAYSMDGTDSLPKIYFTPSGDGYWVISSATDGFAYSAPSQAEGGSGYGTPDIATPWTADGSPPAPTVAKGPPSASQVIAAVNADPIAAALVTASASGTVTGSVAAVGPVFLSGGSGGAAYLGLEGVTGATVDPNGAFLVTPTDANTLEFDIPGATGSESYTVTTARVLCEIDDFSTGTVLSACIFSDPTSENAESVFLAYGSQVKQVALSDGAITDIGLPGSETLDGEINMIQAMDKVFIFRAGKVAMEWSPGDTDFALVASGVYTQPQVFTVTGTNVDVVAGLCTISGLSNTTVAAGDTVFIHGATDTRFVPFIGDDFYVTAADATSVSFFIALPDLSTIDASTLSVGKQVSVGGGFIFQPGFPWAIYFQRRIWGPLWYEWDTSLTPDAFTDRNIRDELVASDILDTDTFDPIYNQFRITGGVADRIMALHPFFDDTLLVLNRNSIHAIGGTIGSLQDSTVRELTREIGCVARKSVVSQGNSVFFLSDNGVYGLAFADQYNLRGVERPLSEPIQPYIDRISQDLASGAVAAYYNNRYWLAIPLDSSPNQGDAVGNNAVLVYNLLNREWESIDTFGDPNFLVNEFLIGAAGSRNDLYAVTSAGGVHVLDKLDEDYDRIATNVSLGVGQYHVAAAMQTRAMLGETLERKRFAELGVQMKSGTAQSDVGISFLTEDPDSTGYEFLASTTMGGQLQAEDTADVRARIGGVRGFNGSLRIRRVVGRPAIRGTKIKATVTNRAVTTQK